MPSNTAGEVFTKGSPSSSGAQAKRTAEKQNKMANSKGKIKTKCRVVTGLSAALGALLLARAGPRGRAFSVPGQGSY